MMRSGSNKSRGTSRSNMVSVLDIGSSKITCVIAKAQPCEQMEAFPNRTHNVEVLGIGHQKSQGIKSGVVIDLAGAERAIRLAVEAAERMSGLTVESMIVNLSGGRLKSTTIPASLDLDGHAVSERDVSRVIQSGMQRAMGAEREVVHAYPTHFALDGDGGIVNPRGMMGDSLGVGVHVMTADAGPISNLELCINRAHIGVETMVATPYASGLASLVDDEHQIGAAVLDFGGGTTSLGVFHNGKFVYGDVFPVGGNHITMDIARGLSISLEDAERLKVMHGSALMLESDDRDIISVKPMGDPDQPALQVHRALLSRIVSARVDEILETMRDRIGASGFASVIGKRLVLTGGASQLTGLPEAMRRLMGRTPRIGRPMGISKLPENAKTPAFAVVAGLMVYPQMVESNAASLSGSRMKLNSSLNGTLGRIGSWLRDGL